MTNIQQISDEVLIKRSLEGDRLAFRQIVLKYQQKVATVTKSMLGDTAEAEDVGQEVFIRFYNSLDQFKGDSKLGTYLTRIAINLSLNELKRRQRKQSVFADSKSEYDIKADDKTSAFESKEIIEKALSQLDPDFKSVLVLRLIEGYSTKETAQMLDIPLGTALSRLQRAQKKLKEITTELLK